MVSPPTEAYTSTPPLYQPPHSADPRPQPDPIDPLQVLPTAPPCVLSSCGDEMMSVFINFSLVHVPGVHALVT